MEKNRLAALNLLEERQDKVHWVTLNQSLSRVLAYLTRLLCEYNPEKDYTQHRAHWRNGGIKMY